MGYSPLSAALTDAEEAELAVDDRGDQPTPNSGELDGDGEKAEAAVEAVGGPELVDGSRLAAADSRAGGAGGDRAGRGGGEADGGRAHRDGGSRVRVVVVERRKVSRSRVGEGRG